MVGMVDSEHVVFTGRDPEKVGEPTETTEVERMEWVPLASVPGLIDAGEIWNSGTLVALLRLLMPQDARRLWRSAWTGRGCGGAGGLIR